ncbi:hypothetical protein ACJ73_03373 [Blastomyces percursus]|uniref:Uncharacterized protein n=1 Tax=Blastomyces percursus TaxID=1658174 RepID=A0A1J9RBB8_9EURO|nr:hypothetical protein ACJ73_03373 [Blastomyces percursus]
MKPPSPLGGFSKSRPHRPKASAERALNEGSRPQPMTGARDAGGGGIVMEHSQGPAIPVFRGA